MQNVEYHTETDSLLKDREVAKMIGVSVATVWRRVADGTFPKPIRLGGISRFPKSEIVAAIETAKANRALAA